jgi:hypothetical protein
MYPEDFEDETYPVECNEELFEQDFPLDHDDDDFEDDDFDDEPFGMSDVEADADALSSMGWGTDEDYGGFDDIGGEGGW